jgi:hypothetical protein
MSVTRFISLFLILIVNTHSQVKGKTYYKLIIQQATAIQINLFNMRLYRACGLYSIALERLITTTLIHQEQKRTHLHIEESHEALYWK